MWPCLILQSINSLSEKFFFYLQDILIRNTDHMDTYLLEVTLFDRSLAVSKEIDTPSSGFLIGNS
jgi:hypothetical protein